VGTMTIPAKARSAVNVATKAFTCEEAKRSLSHVFGCRGPRRAHTTNRKELTNVQASAGSEEATRVGRTIARQG
jgi:hypothetical protein